jgi:hypothetical protein
MTFPMIILFHLSFSTDVQIDSHVRICCTLEDLKVSRLRHLLIGLCKLKNLGYQFSHGFSASEKERASEVLCIIHYETLILGQLIKERILYSIAWKLTIHCKKRLAIFPKLFPARESLVGDIPAGDGNP